ncbi:MAG: restriction endonuclease subunit S [Chitinophagaceae bacterium]|nr:restriction endonuclease subunit S [Chitinophagaceae bacterium]
MEKLVCNKERLADLTKGHDGGIYNGPHFSRNYVEDAEHGVQFLGSSSMLQADLGNLPYLRRKDAESPKLSYLKIQPGMTLISCSGTIGRMVYARPDMSEMWSSQHIMKVVPDDEKIPSGYLYAFLSSKFGVPLVTSGTYGSIIQSIEPEHLAELPVPRLGMKVEDSISHLVELASRNRSEAARLLKKAISAVKRILGPVEEYATRATPLAVISSKNLQARFDAFYYSPKCSGARKSFDTASNCEHRLLGEVAEVFIPGIFKRRYADDPSFGVPYITGGDVFQLAALSDRYLMKRVAAENALQVKQGSILVQEAGQLGGLIGRSVYVGAHLNGFAVSNNMVRITSKNPKDAGYLYGLLSTPEGITLLSREAAGSSIPHMDAGRLNAVSIPWPHEEVRKSISMIVDNAVELRDKAVEAEEKARNLIERAIEEVT